MAMAPDFGLLTARTYLRLREISADKGYLPQTFQEWEKRAQAQFEGLIAKQIAVEKVLIDPDALLNWASDAPIDSKKRAEFAAMILMNALGDVSGGVKLARDFACSLCEPF